MFHFKFTSPAYSSPLSLPCFLSTPAVKTTWDPLSSLNSHCFIAHVAPCVWHVPVPVVCQLKPCYSSKAQSHDPSSGRLLCSRCLSLHSASSRLLWLVITVRPCPRVDPSGVRGPHGGIAVSLQEGLWQCHQHQTAHDIGSRFLFICFFHFSLNSQPFSLLKLLSWIWTSISGLSSLKKSDFPKSCFGVNYFTCYSSVTWILTVNVQDKKILNPKIMYYPLLNIIFTGYPVFFQITWVTWGVVTSEAL